MSRISRLNFTAFSNSVTKFSPGSRGRRYYILAHSTRETARRNYWKFQVYLRHAIHFCALRSNLPAYSRLKYSFPWKVDTQDRISLSLSTSRDKTLSLDLIFRAKKWVGKNRYRAQIELRFRISSLFLTRRPFPLRSPERNTRGKRAYSTPKGKKHRIIFAFARFMCSQFIFYMQRDSEEEVFPVVGRHIENPTKSANKTFPYIPLSGRD